MVVVGLMDEVHLHVEVSEPYGVLGALGRVEGRAHHGAAPPPVGVQLHQAVVPIHVRKSKVKVVRFLDVKLS